MWDLPSVLLTSQKCIEAALWTVSFSIENHFFPLRLNYSVISVQALQKYMLIYTIMNCNHIQTLRWKGFSNTLMFLIGNYIVCPFLRLLTFLLTRDMKDAILVIE